MGYNFSNDFKWLLRRKTVPQTYKGKLIGKAQAGMSVPALADPGEVTSCKLSNTNQVLMGISVCFHKQPTVFFTVVERFQSEPTTIIGQRSTSGLQWVSLNVENFLRYTKSAIAHLKVCEMTLTSRRLQPRRKSPQLI